MEQLCDMLIKINKNRANETIKYARGIVITNNCARVPICYYCNYPFNKTVSISPSEAVERAASLIERGIERITLVSGWLGYENEMGIPYVEAMKRSFPDFTLNAAFGPLSATPLEKLYSAGLDQYNCNLESVPRILPTIKGTDDFEERIQTMLRAKDIGLGITTGYIIGVGETDADLQYLFERIRELDVESIFMSPFVPYERTPMSKWPWPSLITIIKEVAMTRIAFNDKTIGVRAFCNSEFYSRLVTALAVYAGANLLVPPVKELPRTYEGMMDILWSYPENLEDMGGLDTQTSLSEKKEICALMEVVRKGW